jgi:hypothetical protein
VTTHPVSRYVPLLIEGDLRGLLDLFGDAPRVNDPRLGWVEGARFEPFVAASHEALAERQARVEHLATTFTNRGAVEECVLTLVRRDGTVRLPVAIAAVISADSLVAVHVYHSMWPLMGAHAIRSLTRGDVSRLLEQFDADGMVREPTGEKYVYRGMAQLRQFFGKLLASGGIFRERCSLTDDGSRCALEYNVTAWDGVLLPHQAGIAVYERARSGLLAATRFYDDVEPPALPS